MNDAVGQYFLIIGTIYIAPHINKHVALAVGGIFMVLALCIDMDWI
jgi:hypothetical protein